MKVKRYQTLSREEIIKLFTTVDCSDCPLRDKCVRSARTCTEVIERHLYEEVEVR